MSDTYTGGSDRPRHHLTFIEGAGFGIVSVGMILSIFPSAAILSVGFGGLLAVVAMHLNGTPSDWSQQSGTEGSQ